MRQGSYEVVILDKNGIAIAEHLLNGKYYIAAEPNTEYKVKVVVHRCQLSHPAHQFLRIKLYIDGRTVQYVKNMTLNRRTSVKFHGFRKFSDQLQAFVFSPCTARPNNLNTSNQHLGSIKIDIYEAIPSLVPGVSKPVSHNVGSTTTVQEEKKFWEQPSLQTTRGDVIAPRFHAAHYKWTDARPMPDVSLEIKYHTTDMVNFLKEFHDQQEVRIVPAPTSPVHMDLCAVSDAPKSVRAESETIDLTQTTCVVRKKARLTTASAGARCGSEMVDLT